MRRDRLQCPSDKKSDACPCSKVETDKPEGALSDIRGSSEGDNGLASQRLLERETSALCVPVVRGKEEAPSGSGSLPAVLSEVCAEALQSGVTDSEQSTSKVDRRERVDKSGNEFAQGPGDCARKFGVANNQNTANGVKKGLALVVRAVSVARLDREHFSAAERETLKDIAKQLYNWLHNMEIEKNGTLSANKEGN